MLILTMEKNVYLKGVIRDDEPSDSYHLTTVPLSSMEPLTIFQLIVMVLRPAALRS